MIERQKSKTKIVDRLCPDSDELLQFRDRDLRSEETAVPFFLFYLLAIHRFIPMN
jgi:hypothetical protein